MNMHCFAVSMVLIVLSIVHIDAFNHRAVRQAGSQCPNVNFCDYVRCEHGQCVDNKTSTYCYTCVCSPGYTGSLCETPVATGSGCNPPCQNGGQCEQTTLNTFTCTCPAEYTGAQCETSILATHPCITMPTTVCQNGGTCAMNGADYLCHCPTGWSGVNCQTQDAITTCDSNPCGAHGTCLQAVLPTNALVVFCRCESEWTGQYCDVSLSSSTTMTSTAITSITMTSTTTDLFTTATATTATTATTVTTTGTPSGSCTPTTCANGGTCYNNGNSFICLCTTQYTGPTCNLQQSASTASPTTAGVNACASNPCQNGGSCYKYGSSFVCVCTSPYTGAACDVLKTTISPSLTTPKTGLTCADAPCQNGGLCYNTGNTYFCYCGTGSTYTGKNCETSVIASDPACSLNCSPGYCVITGGIDDTHACMCNGVLTPTSCSSK